VTTQTMPVSSNRDASLRPLPWRRMAWVTWRQHRTALAGVAAVFGAAAVYLLVTGLPLHNAYTAVTACRPAGSATCQQVARDFVGNYVHGVLVTAGLMQTIPVLVGAFVGAPILAREFETSTFRYAWTQGFGRARWTIAKLALLAIAVTLAAAAFGALFSWYYQPIISAGGGDSGPLSPTIFDLRGVALPAWTLAAFAIGALAGILIRRVIPAIFATLAVWVALAVLTGAYLRPHYEPALVTHTANPPAGALVIRQAMLRGGKPASLDMINQTLGAVGIQELTPTLFHPSPSTPPNFEDPVQYLIQHGYTQLTTYQPASRFWPLQWIEGSWLLALSLLLIATTVRRVRRRAT
jgi:ABC-type transport system involved in multi-copper enzyme maturation permease subunit